MVSRGFVAAALVTLSLLAPGAASSFTQFQVEAGRSGVVGDEMPDHWGRAFSLEIPHAPTWDETTPVVIGGNAYIFAADQSFGDSPGSGGLWRINLTTTDKTLVLDTSRGVPLGGLASDGRAVFSTMATADGFFSNAIDAEGEWLWGPTNLEIPGGRFDFSYGTCTEALVVAAQYWIVCAGSDASAPGDIAGWFLRVLDSKSGTLLHKVDSYDPNLYSTDATPTIGVPFVLAGNDEFVALGIGHRGMVYDAAIYIFDHTATQIDFFALLSRDPEELIAGDIGTGRLIGLAEHPVHLAIYERDLLIQIAGAVARYDPENQIQVWFRELFKVQRDDRYPEIGVLALGQFLGVLNVNGLDTSFHLLNLATGEYAGPATGQPAWSRPADLTGTQSERVIFYGQGKFVAFSSDNGVIELSGNGGAPVSIIKAGQLAGPTQGAAINDNYALIVSARLDPNGVPIATVVSAWGAAPANIQIMAEVTGTTQPDHPLTLDLTKTTRGFMGTETAFQVAWGDGNYTDGYEARLSHSYSQPGSYEIVIHGSNEDGQQASKSILVTISQKPNPQSFLQRSFSPENQEITFFVLGLFVTIMAAGAAAARLATKRLRLARQIKLVDAARALHAGDAIILHSAMRELDDHAKLLLARGRLTESQYTVLSGHINGANSDGRKQAIEQDFPFLPVSLASTLQRMLDDGRITKWERQTFRATLDSDDVLTKAQKAKVAARIDEWFAHDS